MVCDQILGDPLAEGSKFVWDSPRTWRGLHCESGGKTAALHTAKSGVDVSNSSRTYAFVGLAR